MPNEPLGIRDYLEASTDASKRTRTVTIVLVVASILALTALLNSLQSQWMHRRMLRLADIHGSYTQSKLGPYPTKAPSQSDADYQHEVKIYENRYVELVSAVEKAYVDTSFCVKVPFLGFTFDVNDLGILAGIGFVVVLGCYRFFLSREIDNLRLSFEEAEKMGIRELREFYILLAMRQVFTVPQTGYITRSWFLVSAPKLLTWCPLVVYFSITIHDFLTSGIGGSIDKTRNLVLLIYECAFVLILLWLSFSVTRRLLRMDGEWAEAWKAQNGERKIPRTAKTRKAAASDAGGTNSSGSGYQ